MRTHNSLFALLGAGVSAALICGALSAPAYAAPAAGSTFCENPADPSQNLEIAPIADLTEGDALTWKTTVKGTAVQSFDATYLAKLDGALGYDANGEPIDILLVDLENPDPKLKDIGAWAGASGSPVYDAQGRLVGAVAYGFTDRGESVAGVTPAAAMKKLGTLPGGVTVAASARAKIAQATGSAPSGAMKRIKNVLVTDGLGQGSLSGVEKHLQRAFPDYRLPVLAGMSQSQKAAGLPINGNAAAGEDIGLSPGGNIAVSYSHGYLSQMSVGTVTAVCGDEVWAYGHAGLFDRSQGASVHGASVARIVPDGGSAYKQVAKIGRPVGKIVADGLVGIKAKLGTAVTTVPVSSTSRIGTHISAATTHVSAKDLIAPAAGAQLASDAIRMLDSTEVGSAKVDWQISFVRNGGKTGVLKNTNRYSAKSYFADELGLDVAADIEALQENEFERVRITGVKLDAVYYPEHLTEKISGVQVFSKGAWRSLRNGGSLQVRRGKTYRFRTVLTSSSQSDRYLTEYMPFSIAVPKSQKRGMSVKLEGSGTADPMEELIEILEKLGIALPAGMGSQSFDHLLKSLDDNSRQDQFSMSTSYRNRHGMQRFGARVFTASKVISGGEFSFTLQAPKLKKAANPTSKNRKKDR